MMYIFYATHAVAFDSVAVIRDVYIAPSRPCEFVWSFYVARCQHDDGYIDSRSQIKVRIDERAQVDSARSVFPDGHPSKY